MQLLKHFKELTVRPKNAHELKGLILQLALQGKLTVNWRIKYPNIETATQIYQRINEERDKLIIEKKIKLKKIKPIQETLNMRYVLPDTWAWFNFSDVIFYQEGPGIRTWQFRDSGVKLLNVQNIVGDTLVLENTEKHVDKVEFDEKYHHFKVEEGDLLFAGSGGSWGKSAWFIDPGYEVMMNTSMIRLRFYSKEWYPEYLKYFLSSIFFKKQLECQLVGIQPNFGSTHLGRSFIPIPPIEEQKAIVAIVEALFKEVEQLEQLTVERITLKEKFVASALSQLTTNNVKNEWAFLQEHFHGFFNETTNIKKLRETVLQLAVQGKLTADWRLQRSLSGAEVEDASVLLKRIQKEKGQLIKDKKIKKEKSLQPIAKDEIPYELPDGWVWCRLGETGYTQTGSTPPTKDQKNYGDFIPFIGPADISNLEMKYPEHGLSKLGISIGRLIPKDSLMMVCIGGSIGKCNVNEIDVSCNQQINTVTPLFIPVIYVKTVCQSPYFQKFVIDKSSGSATPIINKGKWEIIPFPFPPLKEQKAIVEKVNTLMGLCDALEQQVQQSREQSEHLMQSCLREVFEGKANKDYKIEDVELGMVAEGNPE